MVRHVLTVNVGSSSVKLAAFDISLPEPELLQRQSFEFDASDMSHDVLRARLLQCATELLRASGTDRWDCIAHRIVHTGTLTGEVHVCDAIARTALEAACAEAPLHNPAAMVAVDAFANAFAVNTLHLLVSDSGFFESLPAVARSVALPRALVERLALRRRGYHGLAHRALWQHARRILGDHAARRVLTLQLGSGASIAAIVDGRPIEVSMGYSPLEGLVMNTRCGDLDAAIVLRLWASGQHDAASVMRMLHQQSGLLGLSGCSGDLRVLLRRNDADARNAVATYLHRARHHVGACLAHMGGVDAVVIGGGVGEHQSEIRAGILSGLEFAGIRLDSSANELARGGQAIVSSANSVPVLVATVDEALEIARSVTAWRSRT
jgi:acetate kinase